MKKLSLLLLTLSFCFSFLHADILVKDGSLKKVSDISTNVSGTGLGTKDQTSHAVNWPEKTPDGDIIERNGKAVKPVALVRISFEGMPNAEIEKINVSTDISQPWDKSGIRNDDGMIKYYLFLPTTSKYIDLASPGYGLGRISLSSINLKHKDVYDVTVGSDARQTITVKPIVDPGKSIKIAIDGNTAAAKVPSSDGSVKFERVTHGNHNLTFYVGGKVINRTITVDENNNAFTDIDLRNYKDITITSRDKGARIMIDDKELNNVTPTTVQLPYGTHIIKVYNGPNEVDERNITVDEYGENSFKFDPKRRVKFTVTTSYNNQPVRTDLIVNGSEASKYTEDGTNSSMQYTFNRPVGEVLNMRASYRDGQGSKKIVVAEGMDPMQEVVIKPKKYHHIVWPWERDYEPEIMGFQVSYVRKQLVTQGQGEKLCENGVWDDGEDKWLGGMQMGLHVQPCTKYGLGLYTGLFYEIYLSFSDDFSFTEHCLYMPLHAMYRFRVAEKAAIILHGGLGLNYVLEGKYKDSEGEYEDVDYPYGDDCCPNKFNMALEFSGGLRVGPVMASITWAKGITDHKSYAFLGDYKTVQNKVSFSVSYVFSASDY